MSREAKKILDFLARRTGYTSAELYPNSDDTFMFLAFRSEKAYWFNHVMVDEGKDDLKTLGFRSDDNAEDVLKRLLEDPERIFVAEGPEFAEDESRGLMRSGSRPWINLFFEGECLEKLVIEAELA